MNRFPSEGPFRSRGGSALSPGQKAIQEAQESRFKSRNLAGKARARGLVLAHEVPDGGDVDWLVPGYLAIGELTLLAGEPGQGKSTFSCLLAAAVSRSDWVAHGPSQGIQTRQSGNVLILNLEDQASSTINPRLRAMGADLKRVFVYSPEVKSSDSGIVVDAPKNLTERLEHDFDDIAQMPGLQAPPVLVVLDPIYQAVSGDYTANAKAREALMALREFAVRHRCAVLGVGHTAKNPVGMDPLRRVANPPAFREVPRHILVIGKYAAGSTANGGTHLIVQAKSSISAPSGGLAYKLEVPDSSAGQNVARIRVTDILHGDAAVLLRAAEMQKPVKAPSKVDQARAFLLEQLAEGKRMHAVTLVEMAKEQLDISKNTLIAAKEQLGVKTKKALGGQWEWFLGTSEEDLG